MILSTGKQRFGMSLVEIMVVLGIIGLVVAMSLPALTRYATQVRLQTTTREIVGLISLARSLAISAHEDHAVVVDEDRRQIYILKRSSGEALEHVVHLPSSMTVEVQVGGAPAPEAQLVFRPSGSLTGRTTSFLVTARNHHHTITVTGATGAVSIQ